MKSGKMAHGWFRSRAAKLSDFNYFNKWGNKQVSKKILNFRKSLTKVRRPESGRPVLAGFGNTDVWTPDFSRGFAKVEYIFLKT
jgi:hypothetical protein